MSSVTVIELRFVKAMLRRCQLAYKPLCVSLCLLYLCGLLYAAFTADEGSPEDSRSAWCEEYHPNLTYSECADVAGW